MESTPVVAGFTGLPGLAGHPWAYPLLEALHVMGVGALLGSLLLLELRVWGRAAALPVQGVARLALPVTLGGFALAALTGTLMFAAAPQEMLANRAFTLKMVLLMAAGLNAAWFHARGGLQRLDAVAKLQALVSLGLWAAVIICGRWIAYA